jgi:hypothetical protein
MIQPLAAEMQYSIPSVRRFLAEVGCYSSFTHNCAWYTLRSIPLFGRNGLWFYRDIGFFRAGSLTKTLLTLVTESPAGMSAEMSGDTLRCRCHGVLVNLWRIVRLPPPPFAGRWQNKSINIVTNFLSIQFKSIHRRDLFSYTLNGPTTSLSTSLEN